MQVGTGSSGGWRGKSELSKRVPRRPRQILSQLLSENIFSEGNKYKKELQSKGKVAHISFNYTGLNFTGFCTGWVEYRNHLHGLIFSLQGKQNPLNNYVVPMIMVAKEDNQCWVAG